MTDLTLTMASRSPSAATRTSIIAATDSHPEIIVVRSARRKKTVSARMEPDGRIRLQVPASSRASDIAEYLDQLVPSILRKSRQGSQQEGARHTDAYLHHRAEELLARYFLDLAKPSQIRWVRNQNTRWGSATPARDSIRLSHLLQGAPDYVIDFVLFHELCHFKELNHSPRFRALESLYPRKAEAEAYLAGFIAGQRYSGHEQF